MILLDILCRTGDLDQTRAGGWAIVETAVKLLGPPGPRTPACRAVLDRLMSV